MDKVKEDEYYFQQDIKGHFVWDAEKEILNILKHNVDFKAAVKAFKDPKRKIFVDEAHSRDEKRFYCFGMVRGEVLTVRFTYRQEKIRIIGAGFWRKGAVRYEDQEE